jgi:hypothetical protein
MASAYIDISGTATRQSGQVRSAIDTLQRTIDDFDQLKAWFDQAAMGGDWVTLGALLNITAAEAEAVYNLWGSAVTELHGTFITQLLARCG